MRQPLPHSPPRQVSPPPQAAPSARGACAQAPAELQASAVQSLPSSAQGWPLAASVQAVPVRAGSQTWQSLAGLWAAATWKLPAMRQPGVHTVATQKLPAAQAVPSVAPGCLQAPEPSQASAVQALPSSGQATPVWVVDHSVSVRAGSHTSQGLAGLAALEL
ncbi:MAG: hypothetical protein QM765_08985 [Myxococcales bacterium]